MKTEIVFIDEDTITPEEIGCGYESVVKDSVPSRFEAYAEEVNRHGQTTE